MQSNCPECDAVIALAPGTEINEILVCPDCSAELEVTALVPPTLAVAPMEEEDWGE